ncbi:hypothetical protein U5640_06790 [Streptomyces sp. SS7]|uniref:hypothetical protein n=1 Tax=Streptomyces sp. SS7 TaxID=3108485 RepID=UPI0030ECDF7A
MSVRGEVVALARNVAYLLAVVGRIGIVLDPEEAAITPLIEWPGGGIHARRTSR